MPLWTLGYLDLGFVVFADLKLDSFELDLEADSTWVHPLYCIILIIMTSHQELKRGAKHSIEELISPSSDPHDRDIKEEEHDGSSEENENEDDTLPSPGKKKSVDKIASYTEMIARAIFSSDNNMSTLQDIYNYLNVKYPILKSRGKSWKNSVRHTLSLNEWFIKIPRMDNGKCCYWSIHPVYLQRFKRGDFQKQRKSSSKSMGQRKHDFRGFDFGPCQPPTPGMFPPDITGGMYPPMFPSWPGIRPFENMSHLPTYPPFPFGPTGLFPPSGFMEGYNAADLGLYPNANAMGFTNNNKNTDMYAANPASGMLNSSKDSGSDKSSPELTSPAEMGLNLQKSYLDCLRFGTPLPPPVPNSPAMNSTNFSEELQKQFQYKMEHQHIQSH